jgi:hypothetical protein
LHVADAQVQGIVNSLRFQIASLPSQFVNKILGIERAVIVLESPGGVIESALAIGRAIRLKGFDTVVRDGTDLQGQYDIAVIEREKGDEIAKRVRPRMRLEDRGCSPHGAKRNAG